MILLSYALNRWLGSYMGYALLHVRKKCVKGMRTGKDRPFSFMFLRRICSNKFAGFEIGKYTENIVDKIILYLYAYFT
jgi:hypothetical protein